MVCKLLPLSLVAVLSVTQVCGLLSGFQVSCGLGNRPLARSALSPKAHNCCCGNTGSCCCDVKQEPSAPWPDMALAMVAGGDSNPMPRYAAPDAVVPNNSLFQNFYSLAARAGTGPPFPSSSLTNLIFRC